jgi:carboxyl-terminal processing protease
MSRRNLRCLLLVTLFSLVCFLNAPGSRYSRVLGNAMDRVSRRYYRPVDELNLFEGAMTGMIGRLGDEHSKYIPADERQEFEQDLKQEFVGIGVFPAIDPKTKELTVLAPLPGGPAFAAGIRAGDRIEKIDGKSTKGLSLADVVERIRGKPGEAVTLTVRHAAAGQPLEVKIVRQVVQEDSVEGDARRADGAWDFLVPGGRRIGYVRITAFTGEEQEAKGTAADFRAALEKLQSEKAGGVLIDLRDNRGGSVRSAVDVCDMLVAQGDIVTTRGRDGQILRAYRASGKAAFSGFPIAVLVNRYTASAAEIVAACLQDSGRAIVVGERSYGKGTVQEVFDMGRPLGEMKFTIATYWRPSGQNINRPKDDGKTGPKDAAWGVSPSEGFAVAVADDERERLLTSQRRHELAALSGEKAGEEVPDRVLLKAVEYLESHDGRREH